MSDIKQFSLAATGDLLMCRRISIYSDEKFLSLLKILREADVTFGNAETNIGTGGDYPTSAHWIVLSPTYIADELKWVGYDLINCAMNHAGDFGIGGILSTKAELDRVGLTSAGSGRNLGEARAPAYLDTNKGRVALMGATSTFKDNALAYEARVDEPGRPGVNCIRTMITLDKDTIGKLKKILPNLTGSNRDWFTFAGVRFGIGEKLDYLMNKDDVEMNLKWVKHSKRMADWMFMSFHWHQSNFGVKEKVPKFVEEFARRVIDAGADAFLGHGPHDIRGVEIYKGKPIIYSLGNFIATYEAVEPQPSAVYETLDLDSNATVADCVDHYGADTLKTGLTWRGQSAYQPVEREDRYWESIIAIPTFNEKNKKLVDLKFYPVWLQKNQPVSQRGRPIFAEPERGKKIIEKLKTLSEPYGTKIEYITKQNIGITQL